MRKILLLTLLIMFVFVLPTFAGDKLDKLIEKAERGEASAQADLGLLYDYGKEVPQDYKKAFELYEKSALQGYAKGQAYLASLYYEGNGVSQDYKKALEWVEKSTLQGNVIGQNFLGRMYCEGKGVPQDYKKAFELHEKSALQGYANAQMRLAFLYYEGTGVSQDYKKAFEWIEKAALQDYESGQRWLGTLYYEGKGVSQDYKKAAEWWEKAAAQGDAEAKINLNKLLETKSSGGFSPVEGFKTLKIGKNLDECLKEGNLKKELISITADSGQMYKNLFKFARRIEEVYFYTDANIKRPNLYAVNVEFYVTPDFNVYTIKGKDDSVISVGGTTISVICAVYKGEIYVIRLYGDLDKPFAAKYGEPFSKRVSSINRKYWRTNDIYIAKHESCFEYYIVDFNKVFDLYKVLINEELKREKEITDTAAKNAAKDL